MSIFLDLDLINEINILYNIIFIFKGFKKILLIYCIFTLDILELRGVYVKK